MNPKEPKNEDWIKNFNEECCEGIVGVPGSLHVIYYKTINFIHQEKLKFYQEGFEVGIAESLKDETYEKVKKEGRKEALEECLEIINRSIDKTDAYKEINEKL